MKKIAILGSTGSIGTQTLSVIEEHADDFEVTALACGNNIRLLEEQMRKFRPKLVAVWSKEAAASLRVRTADLGIPLESLTVDGHIKNGSYISSHLHLNITYLLEADSEEAVSIKEDENSGVAWFAPEEALKKSSEPWFVAHIYKKLLDKMDETGRNVR